MCLYHSARSGRLYAFGAAGNGMVEQFELTDGGGGRVAMVSVRGPWDVHPEPVTVEDGEIEACVADDRTGHLYVAEQDVGVWRYGAEPGDSVAESSRTLVGGTAPFNGGAAHPDVEGLAVVHTASGVQYLLASSQGDDSFVVYRAQDTAWTTFRKFRVTAGPATDGCEYTDGIDATTAPLGPAFPQGAFICQDHVNSVPGGRANQNFKLLPLERILPLG